MGLTPLSLGAFSNVELELANNVIAYNMVYGRDYSARGWAIDVGYADPGSQAPTNVKLTLRNNIFAFNSYNNPDGQTGLYLGPGVVLTESNNLYFSREDGEIYLAATDRWYSRTEIVSGVWTSETSQGSGDLGEDPRFVDMLGADFHLQPSNPGIDAGTLLGAPADDLGRRSRPQGGGYDVGAYEYSSVNPNPPMIDWCPVFPANNIWNAPVDMLPVDTNSAAFVTAIGADANMHADFGSGTWQGGPIGIPYVSVPGDQPGTAVSFDYAGESDPGPYPIPENPPIEGGPESTGDRHMLIVDRDECKLYELYAAYTQPDGTWDAGSGAIFDLKSNALRPESWTSADAAGLPILPGLVRYEEAASGEINHAIRFTAPNTRRDYVWPARHYASSLTDAQYPPMGQRFRLKASFDISGFSPDVQVILRALKKYGMILADNGAPWYISGVPDERWSNEILHQLDESLPGSAFEAVDASTLMMDPNSAQVSENPVPPASTVKLIFIHHSTGENWLADDIGELGITLRDSNYFVSDTNYGWGPDEIGSYTDIGHWWLWFRGPNSATYLSALYAENGQHSSYSRLPNDPGDENKIIVFKSCFPNSALKGSPSDPVPSIENNPLKGEDSSSSYHTIANAKGIYIDILNYFRTRQDKLFIIITAPPLSDPTYSDNARAFNQWLTSEWLQNYPYNNVFVFDFYNVLTSNGGNPNINDLGWATGNHHRWWQGAVQHKIDDGGNTLAYFSGDDHPSRAGNLKATGEFVPLLNLAYDRWRSQATVYTVTFYSDPPTGRITAGGVTKIDGSTGTYTANQQVHVFANTPSGFSFSYWETFGISISDEFSRDALINVASDGWLRAHFKANHSASITGIVVVPDPGNVGQGSKMTFTVTVHSTGTKDISTAKVQLKIFKPGGGVAASPFASLTNFKAGTDRTVQITYMLPKSAPTGGWTYDVYVYRGTTILDQLTRQSFTVQASIISGQIISVSDSPDPVTRRGTATFTITIKNTGNIVWSSARITVKIYKSSGTLATQRIVTVMNVAPGVDYTRSLTWLVPATSPTGQYTYTVAVAYLTTIVATSTGNTLTVN